MTEDSFGMEMKRESNNRIFKIDTNEGFTLVELIVCIAILAIAVFPIMKTFTAVSRANSRAQSIQNATTLAEDTMEEIKAQPIKDIWDSKTHGQLLKSEAEFNALSESGQITYLDSILATGKEEEIFDTTDGEDNHCYVYYRKGAKVTQGETFDVIANISSSEYRDSTATNAKNANAIELPKFGDLDPGNQAVISSELNKYDEAAVYAILDKFSFGTGTDWSSKKSAKEAEIKSSCVKNILVEIGGDSRIDGAVTVNCTVQYDYDDPVKGLKSVKYTVYTGTFYAKDNDSIVDTNIYLFYTPMSTDVFDQHIKIVDSTNTDSSNQITDSDIEAIKTADTNKKREEFEKQIYRVDTINKRIRHDAYFIIQDSNKWKGADSSYQVKDIELEINGKGSMKYPDKKGKCGSDSILDDSCMQFNKDGMKLFTNREIDSSADEDTVKGYSDMYGHLYDKDKEDRIYYLEVKIIQDGKLITSIKSTKDADKKKLAPTSTP